MKKASRIFSVFLCILILLQSIPISGAALSEQFTEDEAQGFSDSISETKTSSADIPAESIDTKVLYEIEDERTENTKSFIRSDGTKLIAQYSENVHFTDENGKFTEYDNSLTETENEDKQTEYKAKKSDIDIRISKKTNGNKLVSVTKGKESLSWNYSDISKVTGSASEKVTDEDKTTLENITSEVVFAESFPDTDIQYILHSDFLKENIILKSKEAPKEFTVFYKHSGLSPELSSDRKTVYLKNSEGEAVFAITAPFMWDSNGEQNTNLYYELGEVKSNQFSLTLITDKEWLDNENRAYPVTVDPVVLTVKTKQEVSNNENYGSATVASGQGTDNYGSVFGSAVTGTMYVGYESTNSSFLKTRSLVKFMLPELNPGDRIVNATMFCALNACSGDVTVNLHRVTGSWQPLTVLWNNAPQYESTVTDYKIIPFHSSSEAKEVFFDITRLVDGWYTNSFENNGIILISPSENSSSLDRAIFYASGYPSDYSCRPQIVISVRNMSGYEDYYSFTSLNAGRGGNVSVNNYNGNVVSSHSVTLDIGGLRMPVNISAVYNSNKGNMSVCDLGTGWQLNYNLQIKPNPYINNDSSDEEKKYRYYYSDADGTEHYFYFENMNATEGKDEDGLGYTLSLNSASAPTVYTLTDKSGNFMKFNSLGNMTSITDKTGNCIYLVYEEAGTSVRVKTIQDGGGRIYTLGYTSDTSTTLSTITDPAGRVTAFNVSGGVLNSITYPDGNSVTFTYTTVNNTKVLSKVSNYDGKYTEITYKSAISNIMANSISEKSSSLTNETYTFSYNQNETVVTDSQNRKFTYQFNYFGQPTGIVSDEDKTAIGMTYAPGYTTDANANKLLSSSRVQQAVQNFVTDPSFNSGNLNSYYLYEPNASGDSTDVVIDSSYGHYNNNSFKISRTTANGSWTDIDQHIRNLPAGTYTASAFISTNGNSVTNAKGVFAIQIMTDGAVSATYRCEPVTYTAAGEWVRRSITVTIASNQYIKVLAGITDNQTVGTFWVDDIQLEPGCGVNSFNIVHNASFYKGKAHWSDTADSFTIENSTLGGFIKQSTITPKSDGTCRLRQYISFNGKAGDVFSAGAWIKADSVPTELTKNLVTPAKKANCKLRIEIISDGVTKKTIAKDYNPNVSSWQFVSTEVVADCDFNALRIGIIYDNNCNSISVTGTYILAEEYGQTYTYDKNGNVISSADVASNISSYGFSGGKLTASHNPTGSGVLYNYNESNNLVTNAYSTNGQRYTYSYDSSGNPTSVTVDGLQKATVIEDGESYYILNASSGKALDCGAQTAGQDSHMWTWGYTNAYQQWTAVKISDGIFAFRLKADPTLTLDISNGSASDGAVVQIYTASSANAQKFRPELQPDGTFIIRTVCSDGSCVIDGQPDNSKEVKNGTIIKQKTYDTADKNQKWYFLPLDTIATNELHYQAAATYTGTKNFKTSETSVNGITTNYNTNQNNGFLYSTTTDGIITGYSQEDNTGRLWRIVKDNMRIFYSYTKENLTKISTPTTAYTFTYDSLGRNTRAKAGNYILSDTVYDAYGRVSSQSYFNGTETVEYTYDSLDRVKTEKRGSDIITYYYSSDGNIAYVTDSKTGKRIQYEYDLADRVISVKEFNDEEPYLFDLNASLSYTYVDGTNQIKTITAKTSLGENTVSLVYGNIISGKMPDAVYSEYFNGSWQRSYQYDTLGRLSYVASRTGSAWMGNEYTYRTLDGNKATTQVSSLETEAGTFSYTYDNRGNINTISDGTHTVTYTYDNLDQLIREDNQKLGKTYVFEYENGNIVSRKEYSYTTGTVGSVIKTDTWTYSDSTWGDVLTAYNGTSVNSVNGKITSLNGKALAYSYLGLLSSAGSTSFTYDTSGKRLSKTTGGTITNFYYAGDMLVGQKTGSNTLQFFYDVNGDYYGFKYNNVPYNYIKNLQGDVIAIADGSGNILVRYTYDAWGRLISSTDTSSNSIGTVNPIRYRGYHFDAETGLYYVSSRYYDPEICRWINADNIISGVGGEILGNNVFVYCFNNPVNMFDSSGHWAQWIIDAANWVDNNIIQPVVNFFSPSTNTISGQFQDEILRGSGSLTGGYSEIMFRGQTNQQAVPVSKEASTTIGAFGKISGGNASGKIGLGNNNLSVSAKGVGDVLTATGQAGLTYKDGMGIKLKAKAAVATGRATLEFNVFGCQIEFGVYGDALAIGAEATIGFFEGGFETKAGASALFGGGFVFRVKPMQ